MSSMLLCIITVVSIMTSGSGGKRNEDERLERLSFKLWQIRTRGLTRCFKLQSSAWKTFLNILHIVLYICYFTVEFATTDNLKMDIFIFYLLIS